MKIIKLLPILFTVLTLLLLLFTLSVGAERLVVGTFESLGWTLDEDTGTLTVSGDCRMPAPADGETYPWLAYAGQITSIVITDDLASINDGAFAGCLSVSSVTIGSDVNFIGRDAFAGCGQLSTVIIRSTYLVRQLDSLEACGGLMQNVTELYITTAISGRTQFLIEHFPCAVQDELNGQPFTVHRPQHALKNHTYVSQGSIITETRCSYGCDYSGFSDLPADTQDSSSSFSSFYMVVGGMTVVTVLASAGINYYFSRRRKMH